MTSPALGIDIAKDKFDVVLLLGDKSPHHVFANRASGFAALAAWLAHHGVTQVHACLEATGRYGEALAQFLYDAGHTVSVVNPAQIKAYAAGELLRTKTDKSDAALLARFCQKEQPRPWTPMPAEMAELQALLRRLESLHQMRQQEANRLASGLTVASVIHSLEDSLAFLDREIRKVKALIHQHLENHPHLKAQRDLLVSIEGIGEQTAAVLLAEFRTMEAYASARSLAAFAGVTPSQKESGKSVRGKPHLSKKGSARLRKALYMPALAALRYNPAVRAFAERLRAHGKPTMVIIGAVMRKLIHLAYGVLKSKRPFDAPFALAAMRGA